MPRVANQPRANGLGAGKTVVTTSPFKTPAKSAYPSIPLNDDAQEKAVRFQSRQALHDLQMNQIKAAASPMRKLNSFERANSSSPRTPKTSAARGKENEGEGLAVVPATTATPMKRVPILANFEEWMKMATDNKINANNSWNFALIDYFHDMSLLKEGDGVNFQKASCTLDGCVKIYTSRVDSVATETGKLLSGLADSGNRKRKSGEEEDEEGEEEEEEEEDENGVKRRAKRKAQRSSEATLAPSFAPLQLKKFELEFSVDPLFKKASADFDEGGAKGLLLNHLAIDPQGRIVFDSSDEAAEQGAEDVSRRRRSDAINLDNATEDTPRHSSPEVADISGKDDMNDDGGANVDIAALGARFFPDLDLLDEQDVCPSLKTFDLGDPAGSLDIPFLKAPEDWRQDKSQAAGLGDKSGIFLDEDGPPGFDDDGDDALGGLELPPDTAFGEGGEAWARDAALEPQMRVHNGNFAEADGNEGNDGDVLGVGAYDAGSGDYVVALDKGQGSDRGMHDGILSYFDQALQKNWAGPEHWRIRKIKDITKASTPIAKSRKEKEPFEINFAAPLDPSLAELIYTPAASNSAISLPKNQWKSKTRNLLPDDKHFHSQQLLRLFLKPRARMGSRRKGPRSGFEQAPSLGENLPTGEADEAYWARQEDQTNVAQTDAIGGNYDANFFQDDGLAFPGGLPDDEDDFADAREVFSPGLDGGADPAAAGGLANVLAAGSQEGAFGTQLVTQSRRLRPEYVQFARVAKKVDVRRLKEEMWKGMDDIVNDEVSMAEKPSKPAAQPPVSKSDDGSLRFTTVMNNLQAVYPKQAMADISTSYCFICLLHLANEKGLSISSDENMMELNIRRDLTAEVSVGGE